MVSASNDGAYHTTRSRSAVIKSSMTQVEGLPKKLKIFRIAGSKFWQMRYFVTRQVHHQKPENG
jgi:hypothetical protein